MSRASDPTPAGTRDRLVARRTAMRAGIVVAAPIATSADPIARRRDAGSRSATSRATPAARAARVEITNPSSGRGTVMLGIHTSAANIVQGGSSAERNRGRTGLRSRVRPYNPTATVVTSRPGPGFGAHDIDAAARPGSAGRAFAQGARARKLMTLT